MSDACLISRTFSECKKISIRYHVAFVERLYIKLSVCLYCMTVFSPRHDATPHVTSHSPLYLWHQQAGKRLSINVLQSFLLSRQPVEDNKVIRSAKEYGHWANYLPRDRHQCSIKTISRRGVKEKWRIIFISGGGGGEEILSQISDVFVPRSVLNLDRIQD